MKFEFFCDKPQKKTVTSHDHVINSNCEWNTLSNKNAEVKIFDIVMDAVDYETFIRLYHAALVSEYVPKDAMETYRMWCTDITEILLNNEEKNLSRLKIKEYALCHRDLKDYKQEFDWEMVALKKAKEKYPPRYKALYYRPEVKAALVNEAFSDLSERKNRALYYRPEVKLALAA